MTERRTIFRRVLESTMAGRSREAQRFIREYLKRHPVSPADQNRRALTVR